MKKFIDTIQQIFSIEELRVRILYTLLFLAVFRLGSYVVLPGVNGEALAAALANSGRDSGIFGLLDTFLGGAFNNASIFGLGIMPYISASIVLQLLTVTVPYFQRLQKEGESGRKKINQMTRVLTIGITFAQAVGYLTTIPDEARFLEFNTSLYYGMNLIIITSGTMFCMWLGERITDKGIGNGISMLIMIGIVSRLPVSLIQEATTKGTNGLIFFILELVALFFVVMGVVALTQAVRRVPVEYARQIVGKRVYGGQRQYLPLKLTIAGVMPIIFAQSIMFLPGMLAGIFTEQSEIATTIGTMFSDYTSLGYNIVFAILIIAFTYFYTAITINPTQIADDMKRNNGFIAGITPGEETANYIGRIIDLITFPGAIFLTMVAVMPAIVSQLGVTGQFAQFYGGTSLLIMVGVVLDTLQQIESYLLMRKYEGMMKTGKFTAEQQMAVPSLQ